jgi:hypothetical protein
MALSDRLIKVQHGSFSLAVENHRSRIADFIGPFRFGSPSLLATPVAALTGALHLKHRFENLSRLIGVAPLRNIRTPPV